MLTDYEKKVFAYKENNKGEFVKLVNEINRIGFTEGDIDAVDKSRMWSCIAIAIYDPILKSVALGHLDVHTDFITSLGTMFDTMLAGNTCNVLEVHYLVKRENNHTI